MTKKSFCVDVWTLRSVTDIEQPNVVRFFCFSFFSSSVSWFWVCSVAVLFVLLCPTHKRRRGQTAPSIRRRGRFGSSQALPCRALLEHQPCSPLPLLGLFWGLDRVGSCCSVCHNQQHRRPVQPPLTTKKARATTTNNKETPIFV